MPFAETLGQVLSSFIDSAARDEAQSSPNYLYILFETTALTLRHVRHSPEVFAQVERQLCGALNYVISQNVQDMVGYAFQIYALFVANSSSLQQNYTAIADSLLGNSANWDKDMKYLIPALAQFLVAMICKYPEYFTKDKLESLQVVVNHLMQADVRMEPTALQITSAIFEKLPLAGEFLH